MKLLFSQYLFSWFVYDEQKKIIFIVNGKLDSKLEVYDVNDTHIASLHKKVTPFLQMLSKFEIYIGGNFIGEIVEKFAFSKSSFSVSLIDWRVDSDYKKQNYNVISPNGIVASIEQKKFKFNDTYIIDVANEQDGLLVLMVVLAINAVKLSE